MPTTVADVHRTLIGAISEAQARTLGAPPASPAEHHPSLDAIVAAAVAISRWKFLGATPEGTGNHLAREGRELHAAIMRGDRAGALEEAADTFILAAQQLRFVVDAFDVTVGDLAEAIAAKLTIVAGRQYAAPDADGVIEHVRPAPAPYAPRLGGLPATAPAVNDQ